MATNQHSCPKCNNTVPSDSEFCQYCGTKLSISNTATEKSDVINQETIIEKFLDERRSSESKTIIATDIFDKPKTTTRNKKKILTISIISIVAIALIAGILAFCFGGDSSTSKDSTKDNGSIITVALEDDFAPFSWSENGKYYGLHVDIAKELAKRNGVSVQFVIADFDDLIQGVDSGKYDLAFGIENTESRAALVSFTDSYYEEMCCIYHTKEENATFSEWTFYNKVLSDMIADGTMDSLLSKYNLTFDYKKLGITHELYKIATLVADDAQTYCEYMAKLDETLSKGSYGIDLQKEKATEYVNNLPLDYGQRIILFKIQFPSDTTYCSDIVDYLNEREDISYNEEVFILEELGFAVFDDGTVKW